LARAHSTAVRSASIAVNAVIRREGGPAVSSLWADLARPLEDAPRFDWIVSNLPFHAGGRADPSIGAALIATAHGALKPRGRLLVVANRHLPYERPIAERFGAVDRIAESRSNKVLTATRR
jgi:16S rRNA (guanine1207-N2)-methyltransferase